MLGKNYEPMRLEHLVIAKEMFKREMGVVRDLISSGAQVSQVEWDHEIDDDNMVSLMMVGDNVFYTWFSSIKNEDSIETRTLVDMELE